MGIVTGIPDGTDLSGNVTSPANAGGVSGFDSDFFSSIKRSEIKPEGENSLLII